MSQDPFAAQRPDSVVASASQLPKLLTVALWASPLVVLLGYVFQVLLRFPPQSRGAGVTALIVVIGLVLGGATALYGILQLVRRPDAWTKMSGSLLAANAVLLLLAIGIVPKLF
jgi:uncharacterized membrane protein